MPDPEDDDAPAAPEWRIDVDAEHMEEERETRGAWSGYLPELPEGGATLRISNPVAENCGNVAPAPLSWLNSARVTLDPKEDAVHFSASIFDPRGGYGFTIRRIPGGENAGVIVIHTPYQGAGMSHQPVRHIRPGTVEVIHDPDLPQLPDEGELLRDLLKVAGVRANLKPSRSASIRARLAEWEKVRAAMAAAKPCRVAMPEEE